MCIVLIYTAAPLRTVHAVKCQSVITALWNLLTADAVNFAESILMLTSIDFMLNISNHL